MLGFIDSVPGSLLESESDSVSFVGFDLPVQYLLAIQRAIE
jgi:hypothetical protein